MSKIAADRIISASWIIPIRPRNRVYEDCAIVILDSQILDLCPISEAKTKYSCSDNTHLEGHALLPGLINCHSHAAMSLLRGYADDKALMTWLEDHIWPAESQWVDEHFVRDGTELAIAEMLQSGTTYFSDMYFFPEQAIEAALKSGIRAQITFPVIDFPTAWANDADDYIHKGLQVMDNYRSSERIQIGFGPHAPYTVSDAPLIKIATYAEELQAPVQIHLHETAFEVNQAEKELGQRPIERLSALGLLTPTTQCVHMTQVNDADVELLKNTGASVVHCPNSNLKLASGACPTQKLLDNGINVALGTDGAASNNGLDMFAELRNAALLAKHENGNAAALDAMTALEMATINGAKALGLESTIGSLERDKQADIIAVDLSASRFQPVYNPISQIVYCNVGEAVRHSWVGGELVLTDGKPTKLSITQIHNKAQQWRDKIQQQSTL
ncbi:MAG: 5-methylthioadenosine/S-adenosylhomocysteine deaminase [Flavobacteriales bacterium]|jgi:5-methylthioadenosine/S-adenosylhomocysteine deaminase